MNNHNQFSKSRAAAPCNSDGPSRAGRAANSASTKPGAAFAVVAGRAGEARRTRPGNPSRFANFAAASDAGAAEIETAAEQPYVPGLRHPTTRSAMHRELVAHAGYASAEAAAAAVQATMRKVSGKSTPRPSAGTEAERVAANTIAVARRAGVIR